MRVVNTGNENINEALKLEEVRVLAVSVPCDLQIPQPMHVITTCIAVGRVAPLFGNKHWLNTNDRHNDTLLFQTIPAKSLQ